MGHRVALQRSVVVQDAPHIAFSSSPGIRKDWWGLQNRHGRAKRPCQGTVGVREWIEVRSVRVLVMSWKVKEGDVWFSLLVDSGFLPLDPAISLRQCILGKNALRMTCKV